MYKNTYKLQHAIFLIIIMLLLWWEIVEEYQ